MSVDCLTMTLDYAPRAITTETITVAQNDTSEKRMMTSSLKFGVSKKE